MWQIFTAEKYISDGEIWNVIMWYPEMGCHIAEKLNQLSNERNSRWEKDITSIIYKNELLQKLKKNIEKIY